MGWLLLSGGAQQAMLVQDASCFGGARQIVAVFSLCCVSAMIRKGWSIVQVPDGWLKVIRGPQPKSERWPRRAFIAPSRAPFSRCPTSPSGADGSRRRHGPRQSSCCQVGGGNAGSWRVGPNRPCITRSSEACTRSDGVAPSWGSHYRHRNFLAKGKEEGRARSPGSREGPNRVVCCRGQVASGERVDCSGRGSVSSPGRSSRCSSFCSTTDSTMRFCARVDARTRPVASRIVGPEWRGRTSQEVQIIGRAIFTTTGEGSSRVHAGLRREARQERAQVFGADSPNR